MGLARLLAPFVLFVAACSTPPHIPPSPAPAPERIAQVRVHVHNAQRDRAEAAENVNLYTIFLRQAVERGFIRAGYRVVVDPDLPRDLTIKITLGDFTISQAVRAEAPASMTVLAGEQVIEQLSGIILRNDDADLDERSAVELVNAVTRSPRVAAFAEWAAKQPPDAIDPPVRAPTVRAPDPPTIAAPSVTGR